MKTADLLTQNDGALDLVNSYDCTATHQQSGFTALLLVEEMSELTKEIVKIFVRGKEDRWDEFYEELADVVLLLDQVVRIADSDKLDAALKYKMNRFIERYGARSKAPDTKEIR